MRLRVLLSTLIGLILFSALSMVVFYCVLFHSDRQLVLLQSGGNGTPGNLKDHSGTSTELLVPRSSIAEDRQEPLTREPAGPMEQGTRESAEAEDRQQDPWRRGPVGPMEQKTRESDEVENRQEPQWKEKPGWQRETARNKNSSAWAAIHLAVVACGDRMPETVTMLKSAAALTANASLVFHIFAEGSLKGGFEEELRKWPKPYSERTEYRIYNISFPVSQNATWWKSIFWRLCAYQRLFLHSLLTDVDAVIYVDTDTLFLTSLTHVWDAFSRFNNSQFLGMVANHESKQGGGWYTRRSHIPFVHPSGLNSGVILMNLTRIRRSDWDARVWNYSHKYQRKLSMVDQDLYNIYLHFHPEHLFWLDCTLNYRTDHCMRRNQDASSVCRSAESHGVQILHGNRRAFQKSFKFQYLYDAFAQYKLGEDLRKGLLDKVRGLQDHRTSPCSREPQVYTKRLAEIVDTLQPPEDK